MSTTTLRIEPSLRERITQLAQALAEKADEAEWKLSMQREAHDRDLSLQAGEPGVEWHEMRAYLRERLAHSPTKKKQSKR